MSKGKLTKRRVLIAWVMGVTFAVFLLTLIDLVAGGTTLYYGKWGSCGQKPVAVRGSGFMNAGTPYYFEPPNFDIFPGKQDYYCTPTEAERAGYSASKDERSFPNLEKAGEPIPLPGGGWDYPDTTKAER